MVMLKTHINSVPHHIYCTQRERFPVLLVETKCGNIKSGG